MTDDDFRRKLKEALDAIPKTTPDGLENPKVAKVLDDALQTLRSTADRFEFDRARAREFGAFRGQRANRVPPREECRRQNGNPNLHLPSETTEGGAR